MSTQLRGALQRLHGDEQYWQALAAAGLTALDGLLLGALRKADARRLPQGSGRRVNVLHLGKFDGDVGGIERYLRALLGGLPEDIVPINLVANDVARTDEHRQYRYLTVRAASHGVVASVAIAPSMPLIARRLHREHRFDIVHLHFPDPLGQLTAMSLPRSVKRVISWHSDIVKQRTALALYRPFLDAFVRDADAIIGATPQHFSSSQQMAPGKPGQLREVIPYGFDPDALRMDRGGHATRTRSWSTSAAAGPHLHRRPARLLQGLRRPDPCACARSMQNSGSADAGR